MKIIHVTSELTPIAKVGGIGDVLLGLCRQTLHLGIDVEVILPFYSQIDVEILLDLQCVDNLTFIYDNQEIPFKVYKATYASIAITLLDIQEKSDPFKRDHIYGFQDDSFRFSLFTLATAKYLEDQLFSIVHLHDWHSSAIPYCMKKCAPYVLTLHNIAYLGICDRKNLQAMGLNPDAFALNDLYSLLRGGIFSADSLVAVSPTYAKEILTPPIGGALTELLYEKREKITGILNGIDFDFWNPEQDPYLQTPYTIRNLETKKVIKNELCNTLGLAPGPKPLISAISRLVAQKGPELIKDAFEYALARGCNCILLASSYDPLLQSPFLELKNRYPDQLYLEFTFNEELSHLVFAASDLNLIPSHFEPCGLTQMISMRYGTLPVVRSTGGLKDSVTSETGFIFEPIDKVAILDKMNEALQIWNENPDKWREMQESAMRQDFSWEKPAKQYLAIYKTLTESTLTI